MEPEVIRLERRGRKRRRVDVQNALVDREVKKQVSEMRSNALVGRYVKKEFEGSGIFLGKIVYYDTGLYRVEYEDGDCEDLESDEVREFLIGDDDFDDGLMVRKKKLDELVAKKDVKTKDLAVEGNVVASMYVEASSLRVFSNDGADELDAVLVEGDADSSSDSCEHAQDRDFSLEVDAPVVLPPQLPPSSGNIGVPEECVSHLFSVYSFLRSFSIQLFLSPFAFDDFVGSLNCHVPNTLLDAIHVALMRVLKRHLEMLSSNGSELASKCLRFHDWSLLDALTWPVYLVQYLMVMRYTNGPEWKGFYIDVLEKDYCTLSVSRKLVILQTLCDDVLESEELRGEIDMREESEVGIDSDAVANVACESGPRRVHPRYSKTSASKNKESMEIIAETHGTKSCSNSSSLGVKGKEMDADADIAHDGNVDDCRLCGMDGTLICCDGCPSAFHSRCIGVSKMFIPEGDWYCPECTIDKIGPTITRGTSLRGAEVFGIDSHGQVFLGTCDHLLVLKVSISSEPCLRYYNHNDIPNVLQALCSSVQHVALYSEICKGILHYWDIQKDFVPLAETFEIGKRSADVEEDGEFSIPSVALLGKENYKGQNVVESENIASCVTDNSVEHVVVSCLENSSEELGFNKSLLEALTQTEGPGQQRCDDTSTKQVSCLVNTEFSDGTKMDFTMSSGLVSQQIDPSGMSHKSFTGKSSSTELASCTPGDSDACYRGKVTRICVTVNKSSQIKECNERVGGRGSRNSSDDCLYTGSDFKCNAYVNNYLHGDFAASAAANLAILSSEENRTSKSHASDNPRKALSANNSLQVKAFSSAAIRFFWPNTEKKLVEVPRERCGWCLSCQAAVSSKRGCLLNAAASNAIKGAMKIISGLRPVTNVEGSLSGIAMYVMYLEESLRGLTVGPFRSATYREQWRKQVEQATTCSLIKTPLLKLEENIRNVALSGDWARLVDNWSVESSLTQSAVCFAGLTQRRGPSGRRGRKPSAVSEVSFEDCLDSSRDFTWWRGGILSKWVLQRGILPRSVVKKAARQGGCRKIPGIYYAEDLEIPKRSRQFIWRASVEMSKNIPQLALQVRYLDFHVRWSDLVRPEQNLQDGIGPETEASAFRNAFVCDKKVMKDKVIYGVAFGNQKHLPSRVMKNIIDVAQGEDGKEKYWFPETVVPLYLIKQYEENEDKVLSPLADKPVNVLSDLQRRQLKASRKGIFSYLSLKRDNLDKCYCATCQLDVLLRNSVKCRVCEGFCHELCTTSSTIHSNGKVEFLFTCKKCHPAKTLPPSDNRNESPTSPLLLQGQNFRNAVTISKGAKQKSFNQPITSVRFWRSSLETKPAVHDSNLATKSRRKFCSWGVIPKKNAGDNGTDFRMKNILPRGNSDESWSGPDCHLCQKPYNSNLMYIRCELCKRWYHAEAVELEESEIFEVVGFKCCRCRRIKSPSCPYWVPDSNGMAKAKKPSRRAQKTGNSKADPDYGTLSGQPREWESGSQVLPTKEETVRGREDTHLFPLSSGEQFREHNSDMDFEWNTTAAASVTGSQKLPVRRHMKRETNVDETSAGNQSGVELSTPTEPNILLNPGDESLAPQMEWDVSENGFDDSISIDWEGLNYEDMEFEPQTYFSFTELLATDEDGQFDEVDTSAEQCGMDMYYQEEPTFSVDPAGDTVPCQICSEAYPDLSCQTCGLLVHSHCSHLVEQSTWEGGNWRCGHCQVWR